MFPSLMAENNYATKSTVITMGCPTFTLPQTAPSPSTVTTLIKYTPPLTDPTHHPKRHPDPISHFATVHFPDAQTNRWDRRQTCENTPLHLV